MLPSKQISSGLKEVAEVCHQFLSFSIRRVRHDPDGSEVSAGAPRRGSPSVRQWRRTSTPRARIFQFGNTPPRPAGPVEPSKQRTIRLLLTWIRYRRCPGADQPHTPPFEPIYPPTTISVRYLGVHFSFTSFFVVDVFLLRSPKGAKLFPRPRSVRCITICTKQRDNTRFAKPKLSLYRNDSLNRNIEESGSSATKRFVSFSTVNLVREVSHNRIFRYIEIR